MATPAPPPLTPLQWKGLDPNFADRAAKLTKDVMSGVTRRKLGSAFKGWRNDAEFKTLLAETGFKAGVSVAQAFAIGAIAAAGVAASAVTFGVAPAIGLVVGIGVSKTLDEYHYQSASNALRRDIKASGASRNVMPLERLPEATMKVIKKYIRVARRGKMLLGGARGIGYTLRHARTAVRSALADSIAVSDRLSGRYGTDGELNSRLLELRYYGQMTYNTVHHRLEEIVGLRNALADNAQKIYAHILRQVHFSGNHEKCILTCYNISDSDFRANVRTLQLTTQRGNAATSWYHAKTDAEAVRTRAIAAHTQQPMRSYGIQAARTATAMTTDHFRHKAEALPTHLGAPPEEGGAWGDIKEHAADFVTDTWGPSVLGDMASASADTAGGGFSNYQSGLASSQNVTYTSFHSTASTTSVPFGATAGVGIGTASDLVLGTLKERYSRYTIRKKVLGAQTAVEQLLDNSNNNAFDELKEATDKLKKEDMGRIAQKILWYGKKIHELESDPAFRDLRIRLIQAPDFNDSRFDECKEAYNLWYGVRYLLRQYGKMLANLVCMEMLLLKLDEKLVHLNIGVTAGSLIKEGAATPPRPQHMKDIE